MIQRTIPIWQSLTWQEELAAMVTDPAELLERLQLPDQLLDAARQAASLFPLRVTHSYLSRIEPGNPDDPLLRQILPLGAEAQKQPGYTPDPLQEADFNPAPGLVHKYNGRVLFIAAPQCAIHCRYCFRRHFDYAANTPSRRDWQQALDYLAGDTSLHEVILSGGDPLTLSDRQLSWLVTQLAAIPHLTTLRIHSRIPVVLPSRITDTLTQLLRDTRLQVVVVVHSNHPAETDWQVGEALTALRKTGATLLNQAVLLKGVNDSAEALTALSHKLFRHGILPYYLHLLDRVEGAAHFDVPADQAAALYQTLLAELPGYLVPKMVREVAHAQSKLPAV